MEPKTTLKNGRASVAGFSNFAFILLLEPIWARSQIFTCKDTTIATTAGGGVIFFESSHHEKKLIRADQNQLPNPRGDISAEIGVITMPLLALLEVTICSI